MGIYDRDYSRPVRGQQPGFHLGASMTLTTKLVIVMFVVYGIELFTRNSWFVETFSLYPDVFVRPLHLFQLLTYGFLHDPNDFRHIAPQQRNRGQINSSLAIITGQVAV